MSTKIFVTREDLTWLASRSFIKRDNVETIWKELRDSNSVFTVHKEDFEWLKKQQNMENASEWKEAITVVQKLLQDRCGNRITLYKHDLEVLQNKKLLLGAGNEEVSNIWKELCDRCPSVDSPLRAAHKTTTEEQFIFNEQLKDNTVPTYDICVAYSANGSEISRCIVDAIKKCGLTCCSFRDDAFDEKEAELRISNSVATIAILTANCLATKEMIFALQAASYHYKELSRIILVHAAESCYFPVPPESVSKCFSEKAITWLSCYAEDGVEQIIQKFKEEKKSWENLLKQHSAEIHQEDLTTRVFLSHKRSTGQGLVGRLYEGLKEDYKVFLDSEAKFKIHDLQLIVKNTDVFVFVLTHGILLSHWCLQELISAMENKKKIIVIRDLAYSLPPILPPDWNVVEHILHAPDQLIWMAEYNSACLRALRRRIGAPDRITTLPSYAELQSQLSQGTLISTGLDKEAIKKLIHIAPPLKQVNFINNKNVTDEVLQYTSQYCHDILDLDLSYCDSFTNYGLKYLSEGCHNIQNLNLYGCSTVTDEGLKFLSEGCSNIQNINLKSNTKITDQGLKYLSEGCHNIQHIALYNCGQLTDSSLKFLSEGCHNIQHIDFQSCSQITDSGLKYLSEGCHNIQYINLTFCNKFTDGGLKSLSEGCHNIQNLNLYGCSNISDAGLKSLSEGCHNIQDIDLCANNITDEGLHSLSEGCHNIQNINLRECGNITDKGLRFLSEGCHNIQDINLYQCKKIRDEGLKSLAEGCHSIHRITINTRNITEEGINLLNTKFPKIFINKQY